MARSYRRRSGSSARSRRPSRARRPAYGRRTSQRRRVASGSRRFSRGGQTIRLVVQGAQAPTLGAPAMSPELVAAIRAALAPGQQEGEGGGPIAGVNPAAFLMPAPAPGRRARF